MIEVKFFPSNYRLDKKVAFTLLIYWIFLWKIHYFISKIADFVFDFNKNMRKRVDTISKWRIRKNRSMWKFGQTTKIQRKKIRFCFGVCMRTSSFLFINLIWWGRKVSLLYYISISFRISVNILAIISDNLHKDFSLSLFYKNL